VDLVILGSNSKFLFLAENIFGTEKNAEIFVTDVITKISALQLSISKYARL
jgi:hypothetical protein